MTLQERVNRMLAELEKKLRKHKLTITIELNGDNYSVVSFLEEKQQSNLNTLAMLYTCCEVLCMDPKAGPLIIGGPTADGQISAAAQHLFQALLMVDEAIEATQHGRN